ncbi:hypothetical protein [Phocaeicola barnesiae]|uniref:hypothetical protein n=1 Tax=Phocaeicola barnesiae TaxID=376804 RepID=UPI0025A4167E|nr:hypothetical protein [Phocaeicola barnesiae]MDM8256126.1 hypothetical protein [Phocaeicola barnesiae]
MRKQVLFGAALLALGTAVVSSCSKDEVVVDNTPGVEAPVAEGEQEIILQVANTGDGLTTRAGRPLLSSEATQNIDEVKVVVVDNSSKVVLVKEFPLWMNNSTVYSDNGHGRQVKWKLSGDEKLTEGTYHIYAVGRSATSGYSDWTTWSNYTKNTSSFTPVTLEYTGTDWGEEVFAGEIASITVDGDGNFVAGDLTSGGTTDFNVLTLHRQVAGTFGYFTGIPTNAVGEAPIDDIEKLQLRLVARGKNEHIIFDAFNTAFRTTGDEVKYVVNGYNTVEPTEDAYFYKNDESGIIKAGTDADAYTVYTIDLKDWFPYGDANNDGLLDSGDYDANPNNWNTPTSVEAAELLPGSVFAGTFVIPFQKSTVSGETTLQLQLINTGVTEASDNAALRIWNINLAKGDPQIDPAAHVYAANYKDSPATIDFTKSNTDETADCYSFVRNHLYTIGTKNSDKDTDEDEPQDLSTGQNLILQVNDNWELIHKMEVE